MPLTANDSNGIQVYSWQVPDEEKRKEYFCRDCKEKVSFVDATLKTKHFRHKADSTCQPEPETEEHLSSKRKVFETIEVLDPGTARLEHWVGFRKADVYWERSVNRYQKVVFEVQASNYGISDFESKIKYYAHRKNLVVVYLFVGDGFLKQTADYIYSLKEIEKRMFVEKPYLDTVIAGYLERDTVRIPSFKPKWARGRSGDCTDRFLIEYPESETMTLSDFLRKVSGHIPVNRYLPECDHPKVRHVKHEEKQVRYKIVCEGCGKFMGWLPDRTALSLGYSLERTLTK